ncbi:MAG: hypothetical protein GY898_30600 [Proteobacteria bacterium]|nr:hypothetical protein [Pseudomonadota bacterium]
MPAPSPAGVDDYFDGFGATAVHTWAGGLPNRIAGWEAAGRPDYAYLSWVTDDGTSTDGGAVIGGVGPDSVGRIGFQVGDEPRNPDDLAPIAVGVDAVRAADPDALIVLNFGNPNDGVVLEDLLDEAAATIDFDIVSYDRYSVGYVEYERLAIHRQFGLDHDMPYWRYLKAFQYVGETDWPEPSDLRWDAMAGVVQGYTGHTWFVYQASPPHIVESAFFDGSGSWSSPTNARLTVASGLNAELNFLGQVLPWLTSTEVRFTPGNALYSPAGLTAWSAGAGGDPYITSIEPVGLAPWEVQDVHVGFFEDADGERYVALQNPTHASSDWPIMVESAVTFEVTFDFASAPAALDPSQLLVLDHHAEAVVAQPLSVVSTERLLSIVLDAGDLVFFKYDTGQGFAGLGEP